MLRYTTDRARLGLVTSYDIWPGNGAGLFLQPRNPHGAQCTRVLSRPFHSLSYNSHFIGGPVLARTRMSQLKGSMKEPNISIYFFFPPITQWCSISNVLFTGGTGVSDFSVLKYY